MRDVKLSNFIFAPARVNASESNNKKNIIQKSARKISKILMSKQFYEYVIIHHHYEYQILLNYLQYEPQ